VYFLWWVYEAREVPYFSTIITYLNELIEGVTIENWVFAAIVVVHIFTYYASVMSLLILSRRIRTAMKMLMMLEPDVVLGNIPIMSLINSGRYIEESSSRKFQNSQVFIKYSKKGVCIVDHQLNVIENNPAFEDMLPGIKNFNDVKASESDTINTPQMFNLCINDAFNDKNLHFTRKLTANIDGYDVFFSVEAISISEDIIAYENDGNKVTKIILIFTDNSKMVATEKTIKKQNEYISEMLNSVIPSQILESLQSGSTSISFSVHSVTIGEIKVSASKIFSLTTKEPHNFYNKVFSIFDSIIAKYQTLDKVRTFAHVYTFAGGLFMSVNKPEKHADESIRFLLELLSILPEISRECNTEVNLIIGVHTGGPVVAGVMSIEMPTFIVLGNVRKYAQELKTTGEVNSIHITRTTYELIFSSGFNIIESEAITIDKESVPTYTIRL
jgi:hypothetical protein